MKCKQVQVLVADDDLKSNINLKEVILQLKQIYFNVNDNGFLIQKLINEIKFKSPYGFLGTPDKQKKAQQIINTISEGILKPDYLVRITDKTNNYPEYKKIVSIKDNDNIELVEYNHDKINDENLPSEKERIEINQNELKTYTPLIPGDIIYYPCAFERELQKHFGVYIGKGYEVHLWSAIKGGGIVVLTTLRKFRPAIKGRCEDRTIYVLNRKNRKRQLDFFNRKQIIQNAVNEIGKSRYNLLTSNCQHWSMKVSTGKCFTFAFKPLRNKSLVGFSKEVKSNRLQNLRKSEFDNTRSAAFDNYEKTSEPIPTKKPTDNKICCEEFKKKVKKLKKNQI